MKARVHWIALMVCVLLLLAYLAACSSESDPEDPGDTGLAEEVARLNEEVAHLRGRIERLESSPLVDQMGQVRVITHFGLATDTAIFTIPVIRSLPRDVDPLRGALDALVSGPDSALLSPILPPDTRILGLRVEGDLVTLDLGAEAAEYAAGSAGEQLVLGGIVNTLTEFPGVERVMILIEGESGGSLGGHFSLDAPLMRFEEMIP